MNKIDTNPIDMSSSIESLALDRRAFLASSGALVVTLAGLGTPDKPHPLQTAYVEEEVPQCAYCINGWIMTAAAFLRDKKKPTDAEIREALTGLKCRCGTHMAILRAVKRAAAMMG